MGQSMTLVPWYSQSLILKCHADVSKSSLFGRTDCDEISKNPGIGLTSHTTIRTSNVVFVVKLRENHHLITTTILFKTSLSVIGTKARRLIDGLRAAEQSILTHQTI